MLMSYWFTHFRIYKKCSFSHYFSISGYFLYWCNCGIAHIGYPFYNLNFFKTYHIVLVFIFGSMIMFLTDFMIIFQLLAMVMIIVIFMFVIGFIMFSMRD